MSNISKAQGSVNRSFGFSKDAINKVKKKAAPKKSKSESYPDAPTDDSNSWWTQKGFKSYNDAMTAGKQGKSAKEFYGKS